MIGSFVNAGESSVTVFATELHIADTLMIVDSFAYYCLGCTLINEGSAPQKDGTLKDCAIPAGITEPNSKRQTPGSMRVVRWEA
ncbi:MAG: hypothetical protein HETSPECPRED_002101 [Heterodermia speciosa]|uniref:Uncharacterized protein n=1 Tax=Heterodermia speciosa TaxID=116794 RepID=A0A8H3PF77_9LECA|nr:MAG: hypothetical protein HETSPECPRED_002101 [Heterodermia speciosa]